jgi:hypothetical protein
LQLFQKRGSLIQANPISAFNNERSYVILYV